MDDQEILELFWQRSETAVAEAAEKYGGYCRKVAYNILHSDPDAEECLNDALFSAWGAIPPARPQKLSAFLGRLTRNAALNRWKRDHTQKRGMGQTEEALSELSDCIPGGDSPENAVESKELTASIQRFLVSLPQEKRRVFLRRYWYLSPIEEIAEERGASREKIKSMLFRMRKDLKKHLEKEGILL